MSRESDNADAFEAGKAAYRDGVGPDENPHVPAPPGNPLWARLWRRGWWVERGKGSTAE